MSKKKDNDKASIERCQIANHYKNCKCLYIFFVLIVACISVAYGYHKYLKKGIIETESYKKENQVVINSLKKDMYELRSEIKNILSNNNEVYHGRKCDELREKWKVWMALRNKMEANEQFEEELKKFNEVFVDDKETLELVADLAKGVEVISMKEENKIVGACKQYLRKIVKFRKIDHRKLVEISGYVLSFFGNCGKEIKK